MKNRGKYNIAYSTGYDIEKACFTRYTPILLETLQAQQIELTTRGMLDKMTGCDATASIDGLVYGVSLRFRSKDYNSFTLNRHVEDKYSEVHKWIQTRTDNLKPAYFIQINERPNQELKLIRVNIDAFGMYLQHLINTDQLEEYYRPHLLAYEFNLDKIDPNFIGVFSNVLTQYDIK